MSNNDKDPRRQQAEWYSRHYGQLAGATIIQTIIEIDEEFGDLWPVFKIKLADGRELEIQIQADPEGNGPGFISGLPMPGTNTQGSADHSGNDGGGNTSRRQD